jgi:hypothetical protein
MAAWIAFAATGERIENLAAGRQQKFSEII